MKAYSGVEAYLHAFLISSLGEGEWLLHAPAALPWENNPGTRCIEGWLRPRAGLEVLEKNIFSLPGLAPRSSCNVA